MQLQKYLELYAQSHQHPLNIRLHNICVPLIGWSALGFVHSFEYQGFHLSMVSVVLTLICYSLFRNVKIIILTVLALGLCLLSYQWVPYLRWTTLIIFIIAWAGQLYGHHVEGKKPSFAEDLVFFLIGPIWVFKKLFE